MSLHNNSLDLKTALITDLDAIIEFEQKKLTQQFPDEMDRMFHLWQSRFRKEALEHYINLGWSFVAKQGSAVVGYFIAQPILFFDGQTQSLWVEHMQFESQTACDQLFELAYKISREKHMQRVYFPNLPQVNQQAKLLKGCDWNKDYLYINTTKVKT